MAEVVSALVRRKAKKRTYGEMSELGIALPQESLEFELSCGGKVHGIRQRARGGRVALRGYHCYLASVP